MPAEDRDRVKVFRPARSGSWVMVVEDTMVVDASYFVFLFRIGLIGIVSDK
jgi:hypothetical protein